MSSGHDGKDSLLRLLHGHTSWRKIEEETYHDVAFRVLAAGHHPDHYTIACFRKTHLSALKGLFLRILLLRKEAKLVKLGHVALDGTKMKANDSKHKAMSYGRMTEREKELEHKVEKLLRKAESVDVEEDARYGKGVKGDDIPEELNFRKTRLPPSIKQRMESLLRTVKGRKVYAKRKGTVEPVFGRIKAARGFRQFLLRGLDNLRGEWQLICLGHNLLNLGRWRRAQTVT